MEQMETSPKRGLAFQGIDYIYFHSPGLKPSPLGEQLQHGKIRGLSSEEDGAVCLALIEIV